MPIIPNIEQNNASLQKNKIFKIMTLFYQIKFVLSGLNLGFFRYKRLPLKLVKLYSFIHCVILNVVILAVRNVIYDIFLLPPWVLLIITRHNISILFLIFLKNDSSLCNLLEELILIDTKSQFDIVSSNLELQILCSNLAWVCLRLGAIFLYCSVTENCKNIVFLILVCLMTISSELFILTYTFIFYAVYSRLRQFIISLKKVESDFSSQQCIYKLHVDTIEKCKKAFDPVIIISLCFIIPDFMMCIYISLKEWQYHTLKINFIPMTIPCIASLFVLTMTLTPTTIAGMITSQTKIIIWILHDKLIQERDERAVSEIKRFIRYVEARGCQFRVYRVLPQDASLLGMVVSFCVTYLIVIIQFTKLY